MFNQVIDNPSHFLPVSPALYSDTHIVYYTKV
ncbi:hypothetical protein SVI_3753 [Shewanella violacea DSS12]|uniref:Uncharacterized protein n=1 Tax=Shewanella violacea (strain JCM 10179 / CIP 106290 / LMG 19151 / DSS12) TaxID=637905 RepID=D4ZCH9_SHEVD|nr:hypothetical protein SVI_3753 [Shewanella violacea DSS12]